MPGKSDSEHRIKCFISGTLAFLWASLIIDIFSIFVGFNQARGVGSFFGYSGGRLLALLPMLLVSVLTAIGIVRLRKLRESCDRPTVRTGIEATIAKISKWRLPGLIVVILVYFALLVTRWMGIKIPVLWYFPDVWLFGLLGILSAFLIRTDGKIRPAAALLTSFSLMSLGFVLYGFLPEISNYPLSYDWSESSRFYDASRFFSRLVYGRKLALPVLDPSRALLQSFAYLIPALPIWAHRLWRTVLWFGMAFFAGFFLVRRLKLDNRWLAFGLIVWFMAYTFLCPVYFHLMLIPLIILAGFDKNHLWRSVLIVALASIWAGISRVNWFPAAGIFAVILYILEVPRGSRKFWAYWGWPVLFVFTSLAVAFGAQAVYMLISGNPPQAFTTSFNSPLYFYRLLPSDVYGIGVIAHLLIAGLPLLGAVLFSLWRKAKQWWGLRHLALASILLVLMAAGLVVSTKIGGGNNLHNLDLFLVSLLIITLYVVFNRYQQDWPDGSPRSRRKTILLAFTALIPFFIFVGRLSPVRPLNVARAKADVAELQALINETRAEGGEVLFIQNRQLLAHKLIDEVDLVPEYDTVFLMEMAMSNNTAYLEQFHQDLENHRFRIIVTEPMYPKILLTSSHLFTEEHNIWTEEVSLPLLEAYQIVLDFPGDNLIVLMPRE
jgi:hypothetical protein